MKQAVMKTTVRMIHDTLTRRGISVRREQVGEGSFLVFEYNGALHTMTGVSTDVSTAPSRTICNNKGITKLIADTLGIRTPATMVYDTDQAAKDFLVQHQMIVVKPVDGAHGNGVTVGVTAQPALARAVEHALACSTSGGVILQQHVTGRDYRVLVIDGVAITVAERVAASVVGDGVHTIDELITIENETNPLRGANYEKAMNYIDTRAARLYLGDAQHTVPQTGDEVTVVGTANIGTGGRSRNRTSQVPRAMKRQAEQIADAAGAFCCGVDFMYDSATGEWLLIELNGSPSFGLHAFPSEGEPVDVATIFVDKLLARYDQRKEEYYR